MKQFINDSVTRCSNSECKNKSTCKRFAQFQLDLAQGINAKSVVNFKADKCEKQIKFF